MYKNKHVIGICTAQLDQKFHVKMLRRITKELSDMGYYVMLFGSDSAMYQLTDSNLADASVFDLMNLERLDVVILFSETIMQDGIVSHIVKHVTSADIPVISVGKELENCYNVIYDSASAFEQLVRHIVEYHGIREVNFISGYKGNDFAEERLEIYRQVLDDNDILYEEDRVGYGDFWDGPTRRVMDEFIQPHKVPPEAIICANDTMAVSACDYLREHNIKVPEEIIVTGIDGIDEGIKHTPGITTCVRDEVNDAKTIAGIVQHLCQGRTASATTVLEYHMQLSQSCGCQGTHLFDSDAVISRINASLASYRFDVKAFYEMEEEFFGCRDDKEFWEIVGVRMPEDSFICINSDLSITGGSGEAADRVDGFTKKMQALVKVDGKVTKSECLREKVIPEAGMGVLSEGPVLVLPLHFCDQVVGYMGIWENMADRLRVERVLHFLMHFNCSAGLRLTGYSSKN